MNEQQHRSPLLRLLRTSTPAGWRVIGEVDLSNRLSFAAALTAALDHPDDIVLDLRHLTFIDCRSTDLMVTMARKLEPRRRLILDAPNPALRRMLELYRELPPTLVIREGLAAGEHVAYHLGAYTT